MSDALREKMKELQPELQALATKHGVTIVTAIFDDKLKMKAASLHWPTDLKQPPQEVVCAELLDGAKTLIDSAQQIALGQMQYVESV